jgi:type IV pilus assembly protein PilO
MRIFAQLAKISLGKKVAILAVIMVLGGVVYWFTLYSSVSDELVGLQSAYTAIQSSKQSALKAKASYDRDRRRLDELKANFSQQLKELPSDTQMSSFLDNLNTQAELVGLTLQSVKPQSEQATENYVRIPVKLELNGTFHQLAKFFYLVGNLDRIINIENITLKSGKANDTGVVMAADVMATTFRSLRIDKKPVTGKKK